MIEKTKKLEKMNFFYPFKFSLILFSYETVIIDKDIEKSDKTRTLWSKEIIMKMIWILTIILNLFTISCATTQNYTYIVPNADLTEIKTFTFSPYNAETDPIALKGKITHELMKLGFKPVNEKLKEIPDILVKFDYTNYDQSHFKGGITAIGGIKGASYYVFDNFTIQFIDYVTNDIILTSNYPKAVYLIKANNVLKILFEDIEAKIKAQRQQRL